MWPVREVHDEFMPMSTVDNDDMVAVICGRLDAGTRIGIDLLRLLISVLFSPFGIAFRIPVGLGELEFTRLGESETGVERPKCRHQGKADENTPNFVAILAVTSLEVGLESSEGDDGDQGADESTPTLVGEDEGEESSSTVDVCTVWSGLGKPGPGGIA